MEAYSRPGQKISCAAIPFGRRRHSDACIFMLLCASVLGSKRSCENRWVGESCEFRFGPTIEKGDACVAPTTYNRSGWRHYYVSLCLDFLRHDSSC